MRHLTLALSVFLVSAAAALAQPRDFSQLTRLDTDNPEAFAFFDDLGFYDFLYIGAQAHRDHADARLTQLLPEIDPQGWAEALDALYAPERAFSDFETTWDGFDVSAETREEILAFYHSPLGQRVVAAQVAAVGAMATAEGLTAAREAYAEAEAADDPRLAVQSDYRIAMNSLDRSIATQLNSQLAFWRGLRDGLGTGAEAIMGSESDFMTQLSSGLTARRASQEERLAVTNFAHFSTFSEDEMARMLAFNLSPPGRALNGTAFLIYETMSDSREYALGQIMAEFMISDPL